MARVVAIYSCRASPSLFSFSNSCTKLPAHSSHGNICSLRPAQHRKNSTRSGSPSPTSNPKPRTRRPTLTLELMEKSAATLTSKVYECGPYVVTLLNGYGKVCSSRRTPHRHNEIASRWNQTMCESLRSFFSSQLGGSMWSFLSAGEGEIYIIHSDRV